MRFAVLSDIHSNLPALEAVRAALPAVDGIICCGDITGYYCHPNEVCAILREMNVRTIRGNHDTCITGLADAGINSEAYRTEWTRHTLLKDHFDWLAALPPELTFTAPDGLTIRVRHASPWDEITYLYPDSHRLNEVVLGKDEWLLCGHTHRPLFHRTAAGGVIANPGAVGQPRDRDPRASWAMLDTVARTFEVHRTEYPVAALQRHLESLHWPRNVIDILSRTS
ncbi:MAG: metallophosphoesterase family protein [Verrucomicrobiota bacterium]